MTTTIEAPKKATDLSHRDLSWLAQRIERGRKEPFVEIVTITPDIARRLLEVNNENRPVRQRIVDSITHDIVNNKWKLNGETIIVSKDGQLNDGQHRLLAVVKANKPVQSAVMFGVARDTRTTVDMGAQRTVGHFLGMSGIHNGAMVGAMARLMLIYKSGLAARSHDSLTKQEVFQEAQAWEKSFAHAYDRVGGGHFAGDIKARHVLPVAYIVIRAAASQEADVETFFELLATGARLEADSPILWLRQRLMNLSALSKRTIRGEEKLEIIIRYWNAWIENKTLSRHLNTTGNFPEIARG